MRLENHLYFVPLPILVNVFWGTRRARAQTSNSHHYPSNQQRLVHCQLMFSSRMRALYICEQYYWLTEQLKIPCFNRSICQGYWCSQKPRTVRVMDTVKHCTYTRYRLGYVLVVKLLLMHWDGASASCNAPTK